jgi:hypothetical protein
MTIHATQTLLTIGDRWLHLAQQLLTPPRQSGLPETVQTLLRDPIDQFSEHLFTAARVGQRVAQASDFPTAADQAAAWGPVPNWPIVDRLDRRPQRQMAETAGRKRPEPAIVPLPLLISAPVKPQSPDFRTSQTAVSQPLSQTEPCPTEFPESLAPPQPGRSPSFPVPTPSTAPEISPPSGLLSSAADNPAYATELMKINRAIATLNLQPNPPKVSDNPAQLTSFTHPPPHPLPAATKQFTPPPLPLPPSLNPSLAPSTPRFLHPSPPTPFHSPTLRLTQSPARMSAILKTHLNPGVSNGIPPTLETPTSAETFSSVPLSMPSLNSEPAQAQVPDQGTVTINPNQALSRPDAANIIASQFPSGILPLLETSTSTESIPSVPLSMPSLNSEPAQAQVPDQGTVTINPNQALSRPDAANIIASQSPSRPSLDATDLDQILAHLEDHLAFEFSRTYGVSGE